jgi:ParB family chromosome partitioning protein
MNTPVNTFSNDFVAGNVKNAMSDGVGKSRDLWMVKFTELTIMEDFNVRPKNEEYYAAVRAYADSIKANGYYSHKPFAVIVIKIDGVDRIAVYDGHTRYDGVQLAISEGAEIDRVPAVAAPAGTTLEDITVGLVTNNNGNKLDPLALGIVCKRMIGFGRDNTEIAKRLGFTPAYVGNLLSLAAPTNDS